MNIDIRNAVMYNLKGMNTTDLRSTITDALSSHEEKTLPGLGVMFELYWNNADEQTRNNIINSISNSVK